MRASVDHRICFAWARESAKDVRNRGDKGVSGRCVEEAKDGSG